MLHTPPSSRPILIVLNYGIISIILPETPPYILLSGQKKSDSVRIAPPYAG
jgi:hypothetical protein